MKRPCENCGALEVEAHHDDYDKPLEVRWLCRHDHRQLHRERGDGPSGHRTRNDRGKFTANISGKGRNPELEARRKS